MNCRDITPLLLAEKDGVLTAAQRATLEQHVAACPLCRQSRTDLAEAVAFFKSDAATIPVPDIEAEWHTIQARLSDSTARPNKKRPLAPVVWFGAPLAAAAAIAFAYFTQSSVHVPQSPSPGSETQTTATSVETGETDASTMVYVDKESGWLVVWATDGENDPKS